MERLHLNYDEAINTPNEVVERAFLIWKLDEQRDELERAQQKTK